MIAQVTDCADSIGAVRMRRPLSRRSSWKVLTARAMLPRPVGLAEDEANRLPVVVDRGAREIDEDVGSGLRAELPGELNQGAAVPGTRPPRRTRSLRPERARRPRGSGR